MNDVRTSENPLGETDVPEDNDIEAFLDERRSSTEISRKASGNASYHKEGPRSKSNLEKEAWRASPHNVR
jgi:hypothetical protein